MSSSAFWKHVTQLEAFQNSIKDNTARLNQENHMPRRDFMSNPYDRSQINSDFEKIAEVIRYTSKPTLESARTATELIFFAQDQRKKADACDSAIHTLEYGGSAGMVNKMLSIFNGNSGPEPKFKIAEVNALIAALEIVKGGHIKNAETAESMVKVEKPEIES